MPGSSSEKRNQLFRAALIFLSAFLARVIFYECYKQTSPFWGVQALNINRWFDIAQHLASGAGFSDTYLLNYFPVGRLIPTAARSPLPILVISFFISIFKNPFMPLLYFSWMLSSLNAVLLSRLGVFFFHSEKAGWVTGLIAAFYLPEMLISTMYAAASESLFSLLLMIYLISAYQMVHSGFFKWTVLAGLFLGLASLTRPVVLPCCLITAAAVFIHSSHAWKKGLLFFAVFAVVLSPWTYRNIKVFKQPILTTTLSGYNLFRHNFMIEDGRYFLATAEDFLPKAQTAIQKNGRSLSALNEPELDKMFQKEGMKIIFSHPLRYLILSGRRFLWLWYKINIEHPAYQIQNLILYLFLFPGCALAIRTRHPLIFFIPYFVYFIVIHSLLNAQFRFILPMIPYGILFAFLAGSALAGHAKKLFNRIPG